DGRNSDFRLGEQSRLNQVLLGSPRLPDRTSRTRNDLVAAVASDKLATGHQRWGQPTWAMDRLPFLRSFTTLSPTARLSSRSGFSPNTCPSASPYRGSLRGDGTKRYRQIGATSIFMSSDQ